MDFIDSLPSNATVRDFYIARTEYNYNLDFIHPIYDTKNNKKPEFIDYYNGIEYDKDEKLDLKISKDDNGDYKFTFSNNMFSDPRDRDDKNKTLVSIGLRLKKISGGSEYVYRNKKCRYHVITKTKVQKWLNKQFSELEYDDFVNNLTQ